MAAPTPRNPRDYVERKLLFRLRIFAVVALVMLVALAVSTWRGQIDLLWILGGLSGGLLLELVVSRMFYLSWDEAGSEVVGRIDWVGGLILALYLVFSLGRTWVFGHWAEGATLAAVTLSISAGVMVGRVLGMRRGIRNILRVWGVR